MAQYRINGYNLQLQTGIVPDDDRATANSFEKPADIVEVFSHEWDDGVVEYDLLASKKLKPRLFIIKGKLIANGIDDYKAIRQTIADVLYQNYVTIEHVELGIKANARLRNGASTWNRITNLDAERIVVDVEFQFDEVLGIDVPTYSIFYGPSASVPVTESDVLALVNAPYANEINLQTGTTNRIFSIALQSDKAITSITDLDGGMFNNLTTAYSYRSTVTIGAVEYKIYSLTNAIPYSTNHTHKILIAE